MGNLAFKKWVLFRGEGAFQIFIFECQISAIHEIEQSRVLYSNFGKSIIDWISKVHLVHIYLHFMLYHQFHYDIVSVVIEAVEMMLAKYDFRISNR